MTAESAISCGGLGAGQHGYGSHICRDPSGSDEQLGTGTAAGLPRLELDWELFAYGLLGRSRRALEYELAGPTARLASRYRDAAQRGSVETGVVYVVEADHPDVQIPHCDPMSAIASRTPKATTSLKQTIPCHRPWDRW